MSVPLKPFEIFCGTGGVGKTTLSTSRAAYLCEQGKRVLLITIDPAKRLKEVLNMSDDSAGDVVTVKCPSNQELEFDALLMNPKKTMHRIAQECGVEEIEQNRILKILAKPYGGLNEILSIIELSFQDEKNIYDTIVLDTPPGSHFLDFLESCSKINAFFDKSFMEIFAYLGKKVEKGAKKPGLITKMVSTGVKKLLNYLQKVTGADFIEDFIDAVGAIYKAKVPFMKGLSIQEKLNQVELSNWYLVTSVEQDKLNEALEIREHAKDFFHTDTFLLVNKSQKDLWENIETNNENIKKLQEVTLQRENRISENIKQFGTVIFFKELLITNPLEQVGLLANDWKANLSK